MYQVQVSQGIVEGKLSSTYNGKKFYSFEGIPYAKPPIGDLRFKAPQEPEKWSGVRDATKPGNKCAQINPFGNGVLEGSEDCLYLNIYTPMLPAEKIKKLPVLFFIHGGRLMLGYGHYYRPDFFLQHNVVFVTINYRLNIFGFLCLDTPEVPGNAGIKDTIMALKWVKKNISNFNGDSNNITVMGESAGGAIGTSYLTSKMADNLYNKIICQSGDSVSDLYMVNEDCMDKASQLALYFGKNTRDKKEIYDLLSKASVEDLLNAYVSTSMSQPIGNVRAFLLPVVEKKFDGVERFFDEYPLVAFQEKRFRNVPVLATLNSDEGAYFLRKDDSGNIVFEQDFEHFVPKFLLLQESDPKFAKIKEKIRQFYFKDADSHFAAQRLQYINLLNDSYFARDMMLFVELCSKYNDMFLCRFAYSGNMSTRVMKNLGLKGATHGDILPYLFCRESKIKVATEKDLMVANLLVEAMCNFAKTGKPNLTNRNLDWKPYDPDKKLCLNIEDDIKVERFPDYERMKFWFDLMTEKSKL